MKTTIVLLTLLTLVVAATVASAADGYPAYVQRAWRHEQAAQMQADQQFDKTFADVSKGMPAMVTPDFSGYGSGWGTAAAAGGGPRLDSRSRARVRTTCPSY